MRYLIILTFSLALCSDCLADPQHTNSITTVNPDLSKDDRLKLLNDKMRKLESNAQRNWDEYEQGARELIKQFPDQADGYQFLMVEIVYGNRDKAQTLAKEMSISSAPEKFKLWAKGFLLRHDSIGKPVTMQFVALDGRGVDLANMKGKVVLVDFWGTDCVPCVTALPKIKAAYDKYHAQGFEVIGISFDSDKERLIRFIKEKELLWPQSFEGEQGVDNKYAQEFGICGIPHMLLLDKKGCLRNSDFHTEPSFETYIVELLKEP